MRRSDQCSVVGFLKSATSTIGGAEAIENHPTNTMKSGGQGKIACVHEVTGMAA